MGGALGPVAEISAVALVAQRGRIVGATTRKCSPIPRRRDNEDGSVPPQPFGPMGVAVDIFVTRQS